jgi:hypothetical protein
MENSGSRLSDRKASCTTSVLKAFVAVPSAAVVVRPRFGESNMMK